MKDTERLGRSVRRICCFAAIVATSSGCAQEQKPVSLSVTAFNYSQDDLLAVDVNGKRAASLVSPAKLGEAKGGGKVLCCVPLVPTGKTASVTIKAVRPDQTVITYTTQADVRQPWPRIVNYAVVHVLPGEKVVIEAVPTEIEPDMSLLRQRMSELGLRP